MTTVLAPAAPAGPPPPGDGPRAPVLRFADSMHRALDTLAETPAWAMSEQEQGEALLSLSRAASRLAELQLRVLVAADRNQVGADSGATSTPAWLAHETKTTRQGAFRDLHLGQALDERFEATRRALAAGLIDPEKASVIVHAVDTLTDEHDDLPPGTHQRAEKHMVELAQEFNATDLRRCGKRLFEVVCPEVAEQVEGEKLAQEEARARRLAYLTLRDNGDGTSEGRFRIPTLQAAVLKKALDALTSPRRIGEGRLDPATGKKLAASTLLGHGFMDLLENHLDLVTMPTVNGSPFTLVVSIGLDALRSGLGVATLENRQRISAGEARRLLCKAGVIPMVLDGESMPLDVGREKRFFDRYQKVAMDQKHRGCAATNCDRPPGYCEYHHPHPWAAGGRTDARTGIPLCPPHHHMADHPESWDMTRHSDGSVRFRRRQ
jgi:hypothetical protein